MRFDIYCPRFAYGKIYRSGKEPCLTIDAIDLDDLVKSIYANQEYKDYIRSCFTADNDSQNNFISFYKSDDVWFLRMTDNYWSDKYIVINTNGDEIVSNFTRYPDPVELDDVSFDLFKLAFFKSLDFQAQLDESTRNYFMDIDVDGTPIQKTNLRKFEPLPERDIDFDLFG